MSLAHGSSRQTGDVDFTALANPEPYASRLRHTLNQSLPGAAAELGIVDLAFAVQRFEYKPRHQGFATLTAPALLVTIGYARRGSKNEADLKKLNSNHTLSIDISFREKVINYSQINIDNTNVTIQIYKIEEIISEKFRALLQQTNANRQKSRRQDVYDINWLISRYLLNDAIQHEILSTILIKSESRSIRPTRASIDNPDVARLAGREWASLTLEIGNRLPSFDETFARVAGFYRNLPWPGTSDA